MAKEADAIKTRQADDRKNDPRTSGHTSAKNVPNQIISEKADEPPVQCTDDYEQHNNKPKRFHISS